MGQLKITKMSGAGNTFFIVSLINKEDLFRFHEHFKGLSYSEIAKKLCRDQVEDQADGFVALLPKHDDSESDFRWEFFNADGSVAEMCGNAARCVGSFAASNNLTGSQLRFDTIAGSIAAIVHEDDHVEIEMTSISQELWDKELCTESAGPIRYSLINSGVPHAVIEVENLDSWDHLRPLAKELRATDAFGSNGANITFFKVVTEDQILSVSFERGVEDFTKACGTGAVAAARVFCGPPLCTGKTEVEVVVPGGHLWVKFGEGNPRLLGPTQYISETVLV